MSIAWASVQGSRDTSSAKRNHRHIQPIWPLRTVTRRRKYFPLAYHLEGNVVYCRRGNVGSIAWPSESCVRKSCLDKSEKRCDMTLRDPKPPTALPQETEN